MILGPIQYASNGAMLPPNPITMAPDPDVYTNGRTQDPGYYHYVSAPCDDLKDAETYLRQFKRAAASAEGYTFIGSTVLERENGTCCLYIAYAIQAPPSLAEMYENACHRIEAGEPRY